MPTSNRSSIRTMLRKFCPHYVLPMLATIERFPARSSKQSSGKAPSRVPKGHAAVL